MTLFTRNTVHHVWQSLERLSPRRALLGTLGLLVVLSATGIHCHSTTAWNGLTGLSGSEGLIAGRPRAWASDHWMVQIPMALSQRVAPDPYNPKSPLLGSDLTDFRVVDSVPVKHWLEVFRPDTWGYFVSPSFGVTWQWWFHVLAIMLGTFLVAAALTGSTGMSVAVALVVVASPFFNLWAYRLGPLPAHALLGLYCGYRFLHGREPSLLAAGFVVGAVWNLTSLFLFLYPPFQIPMGYLVLFLLVGLLLRQHRQGGLGPKTGSRVVVSVCALLVVAGFVLMFLSDAADAIETLRSTAYPGQRRVSGGGRLPWQMFLSWAAPTVWVSDWSALDGNPCEASRFLYAFPVVIPLSLWSMWRSRWTDPSAVALMAFIALCASYAWFGWPEAIANLSGWNMVPPQRATIALGFADAFLLGWWVVKGESLPRTAWIIVSLLCCAAIAWLTVIVVEKVPLPELSSWWGLLGGLVAAFPVFWIVGRRKLAVLSLAVLGLASAGVEQNPLSDGAYYVTNNPLANEIRRLNVEAEARLGRSPIWLTIGAIPYSDVPRMVGAHSLAGTQYVPQESLWRVLDPHGEHERDWNRYAHVRFSLGDSLSIRVPQPDIVDVSISPLSDEFDRLQSDIVMVSTAHKELPGHQVLSRLGVHTFYARSQASE